VLLEAGNRPVRDRSFDPRALIQELVAEDHARKAEDVNRVPDLRVPRIAEREHREVVGVYLEQREVAPRHLGSEHRRTVLLDFCPQSGPVREHDEDIGVEFGGRRGERRVEGAALQLLLQVGAVAGLHAHPREHDGHAGRFDALPGQRGDEPHRGRVRGLGHVAVGDEVAARVDHPARASFPKRCRSYARAVAVAVDLHVGGDLGDDEGHRGLRPQHRFLDGDVIALRARGPDERELEHYYREDRASSRRLGQRHGPHSTSRSPGREAGGKTKGSRGAAPGARKIRAERGRYFSRAIAAAALLFAVFMSPALHAASASFTSLAALLASIWVAPASVRGAWTSCMRGAWTSCILGAWTSCILGAWTSCMRGACTSCILGSWTSCMAGAWTSALPAAAPAGVLGAAAGCVTCA